MYIHWTLRIQLHSNKNTQCLVINQISNLSDNTLCCHFVGTQTSHWWPLLATQIYKGDPRTCAIFILARCSNWRSLGFSHNQINRGSSGACHLHLLRSKREDKHAQNAAWRTKIMGLLFCVCFYLCSRQTPEDPQFEPHGWWHITRDSIWVWDLPCISVISTEIYEIKLMSLALPPLRLYIPLNVNHKRSLCFTIMFGISPGVLGVCVDLVTVATKNPPSIRTCSCKYIHMLLSFWLFPQF